MSWFTRLLKNGVWEKKQGFTYLSTYGNNKQYQQQETGSAIVIIDCAVNDYLQLLTIVAKTSPTYNNNFSGLNSNGGGIMIIELIS